VSEFKEQEWVINSFVSCPDDSSITEEEDNFIDVKNDLVHKAYFCELELSTFCISFHSSYPELSTKAIKYCYLLAQLIFVNLDFHH